MDWEKLAAKATEVVQEHGGIEGVKDDAAKLAEVAKGEGSLSQKAHAAMDVVKESAVPKDA